MQTGSYRVKLNADTVAANVLNPVGEDVIVTRAIVHVVTPATGGGEDGPLISVGVTPTSEQAATNLISDGDFGTAGVVDNLASAFPSSVWPAGQYLTATASGTLTNVEAYLHVDWIYVGETEAA